MKIYKYLHSCLVFELEGYKLLFDPGNFTFAEELIKPTVFADVQGIVITHIHPDHFYPENIKKILAINNVPIYTNAEVGKALEKEGIKSTVWKDGLHYIGPFNLQAITVVHEPILDSPLPLMTGFIINDKILHPVDSMEDALLAYQKIELLILVSMAPFANEVRIADFADKIHPQQILPVHDGYAKDFFIEQRYNNYDKHFKKQGTVFHKIYKPGDSITI
ncbi:MAG: fold metallo-hydrolase [Mucilaginibacter sp.]|nr:fold metallo-hydrolase [Mucilaginibacter sp.]